MVKDLRTIAEDAGLTPGLGRSPGEGNGNPLQYSCLGNPWTEEPGGLQPMGSQRSHVWQQYPTPGDADASDAFKVALWDLLRWSLGNLSPWTVKSRDWSSASQQAVDRAPTATSADIRGCQNVYTPKGNWEERAETTQGKVCLHGSPLASSLSWVLWLWGFVYRLEKEVFI